MNTALDVFLAATDPDTLARAREELAEPDSDDRSAILAVLDAWRDPQAVANLLMHPSLIPADQRLEALLQGLEESAEPYLVLAATVGLGGLDRDDLDAHQCHQVVEQLFGVLWSYPDMAGHAAAALHAFLAEADAPRVFEVLEHNNGTARHNALAWLLSTIGLHGVAHFARLAEASAISSRTRTRAIHCLKETIAKSEAGTSTHLTWVLYDPIPSLGDRRGPAQT